VPRKFGLRPTGLTPDPDDITDMYSGPDSIYYASNCPAHANRFKKTFAKSITPLRMRLQPPCWQVMVRGELPSWLSGQGRC